MSKKTVFHIDVNSAFLSWSAIYRMEVLGEELDLRTVPSIVGGDQQSRHGIVLAKSTPAKKYGIQTAETIQSAKRKCPNLIVVPANYEVYVQQSRRLNEILKKYCDRVIPYSIDESWAEFEGFEHLYGDPVEFAQKLKKEIRETLEFTVNIGISTNKLLAKMAGDLKKPDRVITLFPDEIEKKLWPLPVGRLLFVGKAAEQKLKSLGIYTIGELANADLSMIRAHMKKQGEAIWNYAWGRESEGMFEEQGENKGCGNSITTAEDVTDKNLARQILLSLCETVGMRLRAEGHKTSCVCVGIRTSSFENSTRQMQLDSATDVTEEIFETACRLLDRVWDGRKPLRLFSVSAVRLTHDEYRQYSLFEQKDYEKLEKCNKAMDSIRARFGEGAVMRASFLKTSVSPTSGGLNKAKRQVRQTGAGKREQTSEEKRENLQRPIDISKQGKI